MPKGRTQPAATPHPAALPHPAAAPAPPPPPHPSPPEHHIKSHEAVLENVGLEGMAGLIRCYGIILESPSRQNENRHDTKYRVLIILSILFAVYNCVTLGLTLRHVDLNHDAEDRLLVYDTVSCLIRGVTILLLQIHLYANSSKYRDAIYRLADALYSISGSAEHHDNHHENGHQDHHGRHHKKPKNSAAPSPSYVRGWIGVTITVGLLFVAINAVCKVGLSDLPWWDYVLGISSVAEKGEEPVTTVLWCDRVTTVIWCLTVDSLPTFLAALLVVTCVCAVECFGKILYSVGMATRHYRPGGGGQVHVNPAPGQGGAQKIKMDAEPAGGPRESPLATLQHNHSRLCRAVNDANRVFSFYLMVTLISEIAIISVFATMMIQTTQVHDCQYCLRALYAAAVLAMFLIKAAFCSHLNKMVYCSLGISAPPLAVAHGVPFSSGFREETHYLIYLNHICVNKVAFMYGCLFPVKGGFIFMIIVGVLSVFGLLLTNFKVA